MKRYQISNFMVDLAREEAIFCRSGYDKEVGGDWINLNNNYYLTPKRKRTLQQLVKSDKYTPHIYIHLNSISFWVN